MIEDFKKLTKRKDHYYLIGVYAVKDKTQYEFLEVALDVDEFIIIEKQSFFDFKKGLKELLKKNYPILLHFDGDNVISRTTENKQGYRNSIIFKMNPDDFYFYEYHLDNQIFASLMRKQVVDDMIKLLNESNKFIVHLSIGPFVLSKLFSILKNTTQVFSNFHRLELNDNKLVSFEKTENQDYQISISEEVFNQKEIGLIATFLEFKQGNKYIQFDDTFLITNKNEQKFRKLFQQIGAFSIAFTILVLFVGHQLLNYYIESLGEKESRYSISQQTLVQLNELRDERQLKEKILESSGVIDANYMTQYFVEIGNAVPESITINSIDVGPLLKKIKPNEKTSINSKIIHIIGESKNDDDFNAFMNSLRSISWVKKIEITNYSDDKSGNSFLLKIIK